MLKGFFDDICTYFKSKRTYKRKSSFYGLLLVNSIRRVAQQHSEEVNFDTSKKI